MASVILWLYVSDFSSSLKSALSVPALAMEPEADCKLKSQSHFPGETVNIKQITDNFIYEKDPKILNSVHSKYWAQQGPEVTNAVSPYKFWLLLLNDLTILFTLSLPLLAPKWQNIQQLINFMHHLQFIGKQISEYAVTICKLSYYWFLQCKPKILHLPWCYGTAESYSKGIYLNYKHEHIMIEYEQK